MNKYDILEEKLNNVKMCVIKVKTDTESVRKYLQKYEEYIDELISATHEKKIRNSNGALLGLIRGISDYDELCSDDELWSCVQEAENYYSNECKVF